DLRLLARVAVVHGAGGAAGLVLVREGGEGPPDGVLIGRVVAPLAEAAGGDPAPSPCPLPRGGGEGREGLLPSPPRRWRGKRGAALSPSAVERDERVWWSVDDTPST
ncbi:MAG: hypothetical protein ACREJ6_08965, partial [Candidatus Methylomirabilis sp.]